MERRVSVVLVTGALGVGKSSAVSALLATLPAGCAAVCTHTFGLAYGLETLPPPPCAFAESVYDFGGGCLCCSPRGDFTRLLRDLWEAPDAGEVTTLLVETTGVAEPLAFAQTLLAEPYAAARYTLQAVLCVRAGWEEETTQLHPLWAAAAARQLRAASCVCVNARPPPPPPQSDPTSPSGGGSVTAGVALVSSSAAAAGDLAQLLAATAVTVSTTVVSGAASLAVAAGSTIGRLLRLDVGGAGAVAGRAGQEGLQAATEAAGVLVDAAGELGSRAVDRVDSLGQHALQATSALLDDTAAALAATPALPGRVLVRSHSAAASIGAAAAAAAALVHRTSAALVGAAPPPPHELKLSLAPGHSLNDAGAALWAAIHGPGAFSLARALAADPQLLRPTEDAPPPLITPGHTPALRCACVVESGSPLYEPALRTWLRQLAASGALLRVKGSVMVHVPNSGTRLVVDGVRETLHLRPVEGVTAPLGGCEVVGCSLDAHGDVAYGTDVASTSKLFMALSDSAPPLGALRAAFRACFIPPGFSWAADAEIDFLKPGTSPQARSVVLDDGTAIALWRVRGRFHACAAACPHAGAHLADGAVMDMEDSGALLSCGLHMFTWDLHSGAPVTALGCGPLVLHECREVLGAVYVSRAPQVRTRK